MAQRGRQSVVVERERPMVSCSVALASRVHGRRCHDREARVEHQAASGFVTSAAVQPNKRMQLTSRTEVGLRAPSRAHLHLKSGSQLIRRVGPTLDR